MSDLACPNPNCPTEEPHIHMPVWSEATKSWVTATFHSPRHQGYVIDQKYLRLLVAARVWRASLIPKTSTGLAGPTAELLRAVEALD